MNLGQPKGDKERQVRLEVSPQRLQTAVLTKGTETERRAGRAQQGAAAETRSVDLFKGKAALTLHRVC